MLILFCVGREDLFYSVYLLDKFNFFRRHAARKSLGLHDRFYFSRFFQMGFAGGKLMAGDGAGQSRSGPALVYGLMTWGVSNVNL